jgi:hypothetical protein
LMHCRAGGPVRIPRNPAVRKSCRYTFEANLSFSHLTSRTSRTIVDTAVRAGLAG